MRKLSFWNYVVDTLLHSYSQIFFSLNKLLAATVLVITFFDPKIGLMGLLAVGFVNLLAYLLGFDRKEIKEGIFGFNALLFGLSLGYNFEVNTAFVLLFVISNLCLLLFTALFKGTFGKVKLPFLSFPFILNYWLISLAAKELTEIKAASLIPSLNSDVSGIYLFANTIKHSLDQLPLPEIAEIFFKTLSATFFVPSILGGILIAFALFLFSRISFSLALLGFATAFYVYHFFGAGIQSLSTNMVGSNYIFFAIALGGFYLIPNVYSFLAIVFFIPVLLLFQIALDNLFGGVGLKTFTLAFSILTTIFLYALHQRWMHKFLHLVIVQYYSAEKTVYKYLNAVSRFNQAHIKKLALPFWGEWQVSQGYNGKITHLGDWSSALDFVLTDEKEKTYKEPGINVTDFYCYNKPVLAPADGYVYDIVNYIEDNEIGAVDTERNWGNSIILNHLDGLYSQISHLKKDSFKVTIGDYVTKGTIIATCGSSGRSPEPHMHFQLQNQAKIGAKTIDYPIAYFLEKSAENGAELKMFEVPKEGKQISNIEPFPMLTNAFTWLPERKIRFQNITTLKEIEWEVHTDAWNQLYIFESDSDSYAYFVNDGTRFYFTDFEGNRNSPLFHLYASCYSVLLGAYPKISLNDQLPLIHFNAPILIWLQDFFAPFYLFTEAKFESKIDKLINAIAPENINIQSRVDVFLFGRNFRTTNYSIKISELGLEEINLISGNKNEKWKCVN